MLAISKNKNYFTKHNVSRTFLKFFMNQAVFYFLKLKITQKCPKEKYNV
jgi:hypothetical protein